MAPIITFEKCASSNAYAPGVGTMYRNRTESTNTLVAEANDAKYEYFVKDDNTACITRCTSTSKFIEIPASIDGWEVAELAPDSFSNLFSAELITCPGCMRSIGDRAFSGCNILRELHLNEGLRHIGSHACANCIRLNAITLPSSVESMGCNITGCGTGNFRSLNHASVIVSPENEHLFIDENLVVYAREEQGFALVDGSSFVGGVLHVLPGTVRICDYACSGHGEITSVVLPEGLLELGEGCFSGCYKLTDIELPTSLTSLGNNALSSTKLTSLHIPASCTRIHERSFNFGPAAEMMYGHAYAGTINKITVDANHPFLIMMGGLLCARVYSAEVDAYHGLACESNINELTIPDCVMSLSEVALSGVVKCSTLHIHEHVRIDSKAGLLPNGNLNTLVIDLKKPIQGKSQISIEIPEGTLNDVLNQSNFTTPFVNVRALLHAYDEAVSLEKDDLARARHYVARLACGVYLEKSTELMARTWLSENMSSVCIHFGTRNYFDGFTQLVECGLLDKQAIDSAVEVLSGFNDAAAVAYLLQLKHTHFKEATWDYDL